MTSADGVPATPRAGCLAEVDAPVGRGSEAALIPKTELVAGVTETEAATVFVPSGLMIVELPPPPPPEPVPPQQGMAVPVPPLTFRDVVEVAVKAAM
jgi:hypothetical protein